MLHSDQLHNGSMTLLVSFSCRAAYTENRAKTALAALNSTFLSTEAAASEHTKETTVAMLRNALTAACESVSQSETTTAYTTVFMGHGHNLFHASYLLCVCLQAPAEMKLQMKLLRTIVCIPRSQPVWLPNCVGNVIRWRAAVREYTTSVETATTAKLWVFQQASRGPVQNCPLCKRCGVARDVVTFLLHLLHVHHLRAMPTAPAESTGALPLLLESASMSLSGHSPLVPYSEVVFSDWLHKVSPSSEFTAKARPRRGQTEVFVFRLDPSFARCTARKRRVLPLIVADGSIRSAATTSAHIARHRLHPASAAATAVRRLVAHGPESSFSSEELAKQQGSIPAPVPKRAKAKDAIMSTEGAPGSPAEMLGAFPRQYFHAQTGQPILENELDVDSDDDVDNRWIVEESAALIESFADVAPEDKQLMKLWNEYLSDQHVYADFLVAPTCEAFARKNASILRLQRLRVSFLKHLCLLWDHTLIDLPTMLNCLTIVDTDVTEGGAADEAGAASMP
jgi:hypothetical protein